MSEIEYEWDEDKRRTNLFKHGIDFSEVPKIFENRFVEFYDLEHSDFEDRWRVLGFLNDQVVICVYTIRENRRRVITARKATSEETMLYFLNL